MEPRFVAGLISFARVVSCARQTTNLIINLDHDEWIIDDDTKPLADLGFGESHNLPRSIDQSLRFPLENETELSLFNRELYDHFKLNPEVGNMTVHVYVD